jgi:cephalosporin hydroxylase
MDHDPQENGKPPSHYEQVVEIDRRGEAPQIKREAFAYMRQLEGWCSEAKAAILIDLILKVRPSVVLEIGVYGGKSLVPMAHAMRANGKGIIYGIDPWDKEASLEEVANESNKAYWAWVDHEAIMNGLISKIDEFKLNKEIKLIRNTSEGTPPIPDIDILHVDGNHSDKTSYFDVTKWVPLVKSGGWIIFDDMTWYENGTYTTARAVEWLNAHCIKLAQFSDNCDWGIWKKP